MSLPFVSDEFRQRLGALADAREEPPEGLAYRRFYGLDLPVRGAAVRSRLGRFTVGREQLVAQAWWPQSPRASLLLLHGYYDHMGLYRHLIDWALDMSFAVLACDLPGHGLSSGARASIDDFAEYQAVLQGLFGEAAALGLPQPWHLCGQSTGGAILIDHLLHGPAQEGLGETLLLAPLVRPCAWGRSLLAYRLLRPFVKAIPRTFTVNSGDAAFIEFVHRLDPLQPRTLPTAWVGALSRWIPRIESAPRSRRRPLIVQGEADATVDWRHNLQVLEDKFDRPEILTLPTARHHLANETEALRRRYFDFLRERLG
jgi:alpha-beta hydrolase superfamily lysophospholipase